MTDEFQIRSLINENERLRKQHEDYVNRLRKTNMDEDCPFCIIPGNKDSCSANKHERGCCDVYEHKRGGGFDASDLVKPPTQIRSRDRD